MIGEIYHVVFYQPLYNGLIFLTNILPFHDLGFAIVILTIVVRFILFPLSHRSVVTQKKMKQIEPDISRIKQKFKKNREEQTKQIMALYRAHGISPFSGFLMLLIQLPVFIALFMLLRNGVSLSSDILYFFIKAPQEVNALFLGIIDVTKPNYLMSALAGISQFFQIKLSMPKIKKSAQERSFKNDLQRSMGIQMKYIMPIFIFFIAQKFSSGMAVYWTTSNLFAILHEIVVSKKIKKINQNGQSKADNKRNDRGNFIQTNH